MKQFGLDKVKHIIYAFFIVAIVGMTLKGGAGWNNHFACALVGTILAEVALFGKEFYDKVIKKTKFDWSDIQYGQIGVILGFLCVWLFI